MLAGLALGVLPWSWATTALAVSPSPSPAPPSSLGAVQAWLDAPFQAPPDMPPEGRIEVGITFWNPLSHKLIGVSGFYVRLRPAKGNAAPSVGTIRADWPGHVIVELAPPAGGPGALEFGASARECVTGGACSDVDVPIPFTGVGPPPDAPIATLVEAAFHPFVGDIVAGRPFPVSVDLMPRGLWDLTTFEPSDGLVAIARHPSGPELASAELHQAGQPGTPYTGRLGIPETGEVDLTVAIPVAGGQNQVVPDSTLRVTVVEGGRPGTPSPGASAASSPAPATPADETPPVALLAGIGALVVVVGLVLRRVLADL